ncbi:MAG TPA: hypothetical protein VFD49_25205 [Candidatus Dormibacteraeota bacterium]|nr:hypothetical protein [Candidatus Dormibacteraeota bacterium]
MKSASQAPSIAAAIEDMCEDLERYRARQAHRLQVERCIAMADRLVDDLERLSLMGVTEVPPTWRRRLEQLARELPAGVSHDFEVGVSPTVLLDQIFAVQEQLFHTKMGEWARVLHEIDRRLDLDEPEGR